MTTPAERRKQFQNADAICALEGFTDADKSPGLIRRREAVINGARTTEEAFAEKVAEAKAGKPNETTQSIDEWSQQAIQRTNEIAMNEALRKDIAKRTK